MNTASTLHILHGGSLTDNDRALATLCEFLGLEGRFVAAAAFPEEKAHRRGEKLRAALNAHAMGAMEKDRLQTLKACIMSDVSSLLVYGTNDDSRVIAALRYLTSGTVSDIRRSEAAGQGYSVAREDICRELSGLMIRPAQGTRDYVFETEGAAGKVTELISIGGRAFLAVLQVGETTVFLAGSGSITDVQQQLSSDPDTTRIFSMLFPAALYLRHVFGEACWHQKKAQACLIVDDPLLSKKYGYLNYRHLIEVMDSCNFTTSIGFIPWNFKRTSRDIAALFSERSDRLSLCVHGCDHTKREFGSLDDEGLNHMIRTATSRMKQHRAITGLAFDKIMVFPQGIFSTHAMRMLKCNGYLAAVNSEAFPADFNGSVRIGSFLEPAVMTFSGFPLFLRRYPHQLAEMALDLFWGRPVLLLAHHDFFKDRCAHVADAVRKLNALNADIEWDNLGNIIRTSYLSRKEPEGAVRIKAYSCETLVANDTDRSVDYLLEKEEFPPLALTPEFTNGTEKTYAVSDGRLSAPLTLRPGERQTIRIVYPNNYPDSQDGRSLQRAFTTCVRRYLSEVRDNYISKNQVLLSCAIKLKNGLFP